MLGFGKNQLNSKQVERGRVLKILKPVINLKKSQLKVINQIVHFFFY